MKRLSVDHENDVMMTQFVFLVSRSQFTECKFKTANVIVKLTNDVKMFKALQTTKEIGDVFMQAMRPFHCGTNSVLHFLTSCYVDLFNLPVVT